MGKLVRLAVDKVWAAGYHHRIHLRLELHRKLFSSVGERGSLACGMAASCLHSGNGVSGRLASESSNICMWNSLSERRVCVHFGKKYGVWV